MGILDRLNKLLDKVSESPKPAPRGPAPVLPPAPEGRVRGVDYFFQLRVEIPGQAPYQMALKDKVPLKVEKIDGPFGDPEIRVPAGITVPVIVSLTDPTDVDIDWDAYLATPGNIEDAKRLDNRKTWVAMGEQFKRQPVAFQEQVRAGNKFAVNAAAQAVIAGQLDRQMFEEQHEQAYYMGHLAPEDLQAAIAFIDANTAAAAADEGAQA